MGAFFAAFGGLFAIITVIRKLLDPTMPAGWASLFCCLLFFSGLIMLVLGVLGEYIGKLILSINGTPQYIVRETVNIRPEDGGRPAAAKAVRNDAGSGALEK